MAVKNAFIRGSVVRYVKVPSNAVDTTLLEDATRRGSSGSGFRASLTSCRGQGGQQVGRIDLYKDVAGIMIFNPTRDYTSGIHVILGPAKVRVR
jgi:hypothetical protein